MKLLLDQNLPRRLAELLRDEGHDVVHTEDVELETTADPEILTWCCSNERHLVTGDKKLTKFLAASGGLCPSVLITRDMRTIPSDDMAAILVANLPQIERLIAEHGNVVLSLSPDKPIRAVLLPLGLGG